MKSLIIRNSSDRGHFDFGWLDTRHTFSFGSYYDADFMGFEKLRVINEDRVKPGRGFGPHPHRDMEILTYVISGAIHHKDSLGNESVLETGQIQRMTAGSGVYHSEFNASNTDPLHFLQIWIEPNSKNLEPDYETREWTSTESGLVLLASPTGEDKSLSIHQSVKIYGAKWNNATAYEHSSPGRSWIQIISGFVDVNGTNLEPGDGAAIVSKHVSLTTRSSAEFILFEFLKGESNEQ